MKLITVPGTHGTPDDPRNEWWFDGSPGYAPSPWWQMAARFGCEPAKSHDPFTWSGDLDLLEVSFLRRRTHSDWKAGGSALRYYAETLPYEDRNFVLHSHGRQVFLYACADGLLARSAVVVSGPVRGGLMMQVAEQARPNIAKWMHLYDPEWDWMLQLGELFDGHYGIQRRDPFADLNYPVPGGSHSHVLFTPEFIDLWGKRRWFDWMRSSEPARIVVPT